MSRVASSNPARVFYFLTLSLFISFKSCCLHNTFPNSIQSMGLRWPPWCEQSSLNSRSNAHSDGAAMAPLCKLVKRGAVRANDLPLSNDSEAWPDSSVGRALDVQSQGSRVRIPLGSGIFSHFHFSKNIFEVYFHIYILSNH